MLQHRLPLNIIRCVHLLLGVLLMALMSTCPAWAAEYTLEWDPNTEPELAGYKVYWGTQSRNYTHSADAGNATSFTVTGLTEGTVYFFAATAYDAYGHESEYSAEVSSAAHRMILGIGPNESDGGWIDVLGPTYDHMHWLKVSWPDYNTLGGEARVATGDIDGDGLDEIVIGLGPTPSMPGFAEGRFEVVDDDYSHLAWGQVQWQEYNLLVGETWPATGDLDGDGRDEILLGLGPGSKGKVAIFSYANGTLTQTGWTEIGWPDYAKAHGETRVAAGDLDGDGRDEVVIGLGPVENNPTFPDGVFRVRDDDLSHLAWWKILWTDYRSLNGETRPATGDLDGDGRDEILMGLGPGGGGTLEAFSVDGTAINHMQWLNIGWPEYAQSFGETRPAIGDVDGDGLDEMLIGLGRGGLGRNMLLDDSLKKFEHLLTLELWPPDYAATEGSSWPAIQKTQ